jgi:hypothetical protein
LGVGEGKQDVQTSIFAFGSNIVESASGQSALGGAKAARA